VNGPDLPPGWQAQLDTELAAMRDATLRIYRLASSRPQWLYGTGCCDQWTPEDGCRWHTGRPAMSLAARELGSPAESAAAAAKRARDARAVQLDRMARHRLVAIVREHGGTWLMGGPETWTKDELTAEILRAEYPEVTR
jgi:hypothetical protein